MFFNFVRKSICALLLFLVIVSLHVTDRPTTAWLREYVAFTVKTDIDLTPIADKAKNLGAFTQKVVWRDFVESLTVHPVATQPTGESRR